MTETTRLVVTLEMTEEEHARMLVSECVYVLTYVNSDGEITRAWPDAIGTREECEIAEAARVGRIYVVPIEGVHLEHYIVEASKVLPL